MYKLFCQDVWKKAIFSYFSDVEKNNAAKFQFYFTFAKNKCGGGGGAPKNKKKNGWG
jgi:hypothetical protein